MHKKQWLITGFLLSLLNGAILAISIQIIGFETQYFITLMMTFTGITFIINASALFIFSRAAGHFFKGVNENLASLSKGYFTTLSSQSYFKDKFNTTYQYFETLRQLFNTWITDLLYSAVAVKSSSDKIDHVTKDTHAAIAVLNESLNDIRSVFESTTFMLSDISGVTINMAQSSVAIAENSQKAVTRVKEVNQTAHHGSDAVAQVVTTMYHINKDVTEAKETIVKLEQASSEIGAITSTISTISEQTNLLALNAAIEAARAGEHGRGFAVVADEVRKLADESHKAASRIDVLIKTVQLEVLDAVSAIQKAHENVDNGVKIAENAGGNLKNILQAVEQTESVFNDISLDITQQSKATENMSASIQEITSSAQSGTASVEEISSIVESQIAYLEENRKITDHLLHIADSLEKTMEIFDKNIGEDMLSSCDYLNARLPLQNNELVEISKQLGLSEIHVVDRDGYIKYSSNSDIIGFQFSNEAGTQTYDFMKIFSDPKRRVNQKSAFRDVDGKLFKYVGILSSDSHFLIQVGLEASQITNYKGANAGI
jgi:methyl-accepting chemotaxis protein